VAIEYTWAVVTADYTVDGTGAPTAVQTYHWTCTAAEGDVTHSSYGTVGVPEGDPAAVIPTDGADAVAKMTSLVDMAAIEGQLEGMFDADAAPSTGSGKPWEFPAGAKEWMAGVAYAVGDFVVYDSMSYECIQAHTSQRSWTPPVVPALFEAYRVPTGPGPLDWVAGEAVEIGDRRIYETVEYEAIQAHTTQVGWEPPNVPALWTAV